MPAPHPNALKFAVSLLAGLLIVSAGWWFGKSPSMEQATTPEPSKGQSLARQNTVTERTHATNKASAIISTPIQCPRCDCTGENSSDRKSANIPPETRSTSAEQELFEIIQDALTDIDSQAEVLIDCNQLPCFAMVVTGEELNSETVTKISEAVSTLEGESWVSGRTHASIGDDSYHIRSFAPVLKNTDHSELSERWMTSVQQYFKERRGQN